MMWFEKNPVEFEFTLSLDNWEMQHQPNNARQPHSLKRNSETRVDIETAPGIHPIDLIF